MNYLRRCRPRCVVLSYSWAWSSVCRSVGPTRQAGGRRVDWLVCLGDWSLTGSPARSVAATAAAATTGIHSQLQSFHDKATESREISAVFPTDDESRKAHSATVVVAVAVGSTSQAAREREPNRQHSCYCIRFSSSHFKLGIHDNCFSSRAAPQLESGIPPSFPVSCLSAIPSSAAPSRRTSMVERTACPHEPSWRRKRCQS